MNALAFYTLAHARRLEVAGFSRQQAEALAEEQVKLMDERLATKTDIEALKLATDARTREAELRLEGKIEAVKTDILKWIVGTVGIQTVVMVGAITGLLRLFLH